MFKQKNENKDIEDIKIEKAIEKTEKRFPPYFIAVAVSLIIFPFGLHWYLRDTFLEPLIIKLTFISVPLGIIGVLIYLISILKSIKK